MCGRYSGIDQRFINQFVDEQISIGDYIISGGELAAAVVIDSVVRLLPHVLGNELSSQEESFADGLLEAPLFTRPQKIEDKIVPKVFLSGDHLKIAKARKLIGLVYTHAKRPDLIRPEHLANYNEFSSLIADFTNEDWQACGISRNEKEGFLNAAKN